MHVYNSNKISIMKKLLSILFIASSSMWASAQCTPTGYDFGAAPYGIYPDTSVGLNTGILNTPYEQVMYIKVPIQASEIPAEFIPPTIDPALLALATIDYIKIDCEGFEYRVLQGAKETIQRCRPVVVIEQKPHDMYSKDYGQFAAVGLLESWGMIRLDQVKDDWIMGWL